MELALGINPVPVPIFNSDLIWSEMLLEKPTSELNLFSSEVGGHIRFFKQRFEA